MKIIPNFNPSDKKPLALTIGHFDGVHIGHQAIIKKLVSVADDKNLLPAVMSFLPHARIFFENVDNFLISSEREKQRYLLAHGIQRLYQIPFDKAFSQLSPHAFIDKLLSLNIGYLLVGDDFRFGHRGAGSFPLLAQICRDGGILVEKSPTLDYQQQRISSSRIRQAIKTDDFDLAETLLNRKLSYRGKVSKGKQLGRTLHFPTANFRLPSTRLLPHGVFAVSVAIEKDQNRYRGMANIGTKPTVDNDNIRQIEVHLFDFSADLYDKYITVTLEKKLRDEKKFNHLDELITQLHQDKQQANIALGNLGNR